jgi:hypothetical protein
MSRSGLVRLVASWSYWPAILVALFFWWTSDRRRIVAQFEALQEALEKSGDEGTFDRLGHARGVSEVFADGFVILAQPYEGTIADRQQLMGIVDRYRASAERITVSDSEVDVELRPNATAEMSAVVEATGHEARRSRARAVCGSASPGGRMPASGGSRSSRCSKSSTPPACFSEAARNPAQSHQARANRPTIASRIVSFATAARSMPSQVAKPTFPACSRSRRAYHSPARAPANGPTRSPGRPEGETDERADERPDDRQLAGSGALGTERGGGDVDAEGQAGEQEERRQGHPTDAVEAVRGGAGDEAEEDQRRPWNRRQHGTGEAR